MTTDGCGVPIVSMPLNNLVMGFKNLCEKYPQIMNSIMQNPYIYGGEDRLETEIIQTSYKLIAKVGAGGLCAVYNTAEKTGFAVKINDASMPARKVFVSDLIRKLNWGNLPCEKDIKTISGKIVGKIEVIYL
jgi:L-asparaginase II